MKRRSFLKGIAAAFAVKALPAPPVAGELRGEVFGYGQPSKLWGEQLKAKFFDGPLTNLKTAGQLASDQTYIVASLRAWMFFDDDRQALRFQVEDDDTALL